MVVALIPLVVASVVRQGLRPAILAALGTGALFAVATLAVSRLDIPLRHRIGVGMWWWCYFVPFAASTGSLRRVLDREHERTVRAKAEVMAEHAEAAEEWDLRARLLEVQRLREEGLRVVLHDASAIRGGATADERTASEGLGLWIIEQLVSALGGTFSLEPREGGPARLGRNYSQLISRSPDIRLAAYVTAGSLHQRTKRDVARDAVGPRGPGLARMPRAVNRVTCAG